MPGQAVRQKRQSNQARATKYGVEQGLPSNVDAERTILGAALLHPDVIHESIAAGVQDVFFSVDSNRIIFRAMRDLAVANTPIDLITVGEYLSRKNLVEFVGGIAYVSSLTDGMPLRVALDRYVEMLRDCYQRRAVIFAANKAIAMVMEPAQDVTECIGGLSDELLGIKADTITNPARQIGEIAEETLPEIWSQMHSTREVIGLPFGVPEFDLSTTGIRDGEVVILAGYPGSGKTAFITQVLFDNARIAGVPTELYSLEMKQSAVAKRVFSNYTGVSSTLIRNPRHLGVQDYRMLEQSVPYLKEIPFWIDDRCGQDITEIIARARINIRKKGIKAVGIDFLQMVEAPGDKRNEQLCYAMKLIADTAKETNVPFVVLSQLSRPEGRDPNVVPNMFMLRDSGGIEQFAHLIGFTFRPQDDNRQPTGDDLLVIGKQREGMVGPIPARFNTRCLRWEERPVGDPTPLPEAQQTLGLGGTSSTKSKSKSKQGAKQNANGSQQETGSATEGEGEGSGQQDSPPGE